MAYRNLTFRSLASDIRTETYLGEEHIVIPCIALVGDEVVYGLNAEGPEFIPAEELEFSTLGWSGRPVLYDHPADSTSTANEPATLQAMSFGQIFHPRFEDGKLKVEAWCSKRRALDIGQDDLIESIENGEAIELSVGAIISLDKTPGIAPNGKRYESSWFGIQSDHLAIGLSGSQGACNIEMGCGANRVLKSGNNASTLGNDTSTLDSESRSMRAMRGDDPMPEPRTPSISTRAASSRKPTLPTLDIKPRSLKQRILSLASQAFRSLAEDEGMSDKELRDKLWDQLYAVEPAFYGIENVYQESSTVTYITSPDKKLHMWRRSFTTGDDGAVSINEDREEVAVTDFYYIYMGENPTANAATIAAQAGDKPCGCQTAAMNADQSIVTNETTNETDNSTEDTNMADDAKDTKTAVTPESGSSEAATPSQSGSEDKTVPNYPAGQTAPAQTDTDSRPVSGDGKSLDSSKPLTEDEQIDKLPASLKSMVKRYQAQEKAEREWLIGALSKSQKAYSKAQLESKPTEELRQIAELAGVGMRETGNTGDFSGRMMVAREGELPPPPDPWGVAKHLKRADSAN